MHVPTSLGLNINPGCPPISPPSPLTPRAPAFSLFTVFCVSVYSPPMRPLLNLLTWLLLLAAALTLVWLVQMFPATLTLTGTAAGGGHWQLTTSLAVAVVAQLVVLVLTAYSALLVHTLFRSWRHLQGWLKTQYHTLTQRSSAPDA